MISKERLKELIAIADARYAASLVENLNPTDDNLDVIQQTADILDALRELETRRAREGA